jgi:hypothetical protein
MLLLRSLLMMLVVTLPAVLRAQTPDVLKWKFSLQDEFRLETTTELTQTIRVKNQAELPPQAVKHVQVSRYKVKAVEGEGTVLEQQIESIRAESAAGAAPPPKLFQQLEGTVLKITLSPTFQVVKLEGYEEMLKKVAGDDATLERSVASLLPKETLTRSLEESFAFLPPAGTAAGGTWERKFTAGLGPLGTLNITNVYKLEGNEAVDGRQTVRVACKPQVTYSKPAGKSAELPIQITNGNITVEQAEGNLWFDPAAGKLVKSEMKMKLKGTLTVQSSGQEDVVEIGQELSVKIRMLEAAK